MVAKNWQDSRSFGYTLLLLPSSWPLFLLDYGTARKGEGPEKF